MKKTYTSWLTFTFIFMYFVGFAQVPSAIYFKSGKVLYGEFNISSDRKNIEIKTKDSSYLVELTQVNTIQNDPNIKAEKRTAYGVLKGGFHSLNASLGISVSAGFWLNRNLKLGAGLELYKSLEKQEPQKLYLSEYMPVFAELRYEFASAKAVPYLMLQTGFGYVVRNQLDNFENTPLLSHRTKQGSLCAGLYGGFKYKIKTGWHWFWEAGGKLQGYTTKTTVYDNGAKIVTDNTENFVFLNINLGLMW